MSSPGLLFEVCRPLLRDRSGQQALRQRFEEEYLPHLFAPTTIPRVYCYQRADEVATGGARSFVSLSPAPSFESLQNSVWPATGNANQLLLPLSPQTPNTSLPKDLLFSIPTSQEQESTNTAKRQRSPSVEVEGSKRLRVVFLQTSSLKRKMTIFVSSSSLGREMTMSLKEVKRKRTLDSISTR
jgi:hypothetical protein